MTSATHIPHCSCIDWLVDLLQFETGPFPSPPYYQARFSNGRVWIELVAATFGDNLEDFATGNAISGATGERPGSFAVQQPFANLSAPATVLVPSTLQQVGCLLSNVAACSRDVSIEASADTSFIIELCCSLHQTAALGCVP